MGHQFWIWILCLLLSIGPNQHLMNVSHSAKHLVLVVLVNCLCMPSNLNPWIGGCDLKFHKHMSKIITSIIYHKRVIYLNLQCHYNKRFNVIYQIKLTNDRAGFQIEQPYKALLNTKKGNYYYLQLHLLLFVEFVISSTSLHSFPRWVLESALAPVSSKDGKKEWAKAQWEIFASPSYQLSRFNLIIN